MAEFERQKREEVERFEEYKREEIKKLKYVLVRHCQGVQRSLVMLPHSGKSVRCLSHTSEKQELPETRETKKRLRC